MWFYLDGFLNVFGLGLFLELFLRFGDLGIFLDDFEIGEAQNSDQTLYFAKPKIPSSYPREIYAMKALKSTNPSIIQNSEANLKHFCQFVRHAYLLRPDFYGFNKNKEICVFMENLKVDLGFILSNRSRKNEPFTSEEIKNFLKQVAKAIEELEIKDFPHGNIKPSNILQTFSGSYKFTDVGLPSNNDSSFYKSPEQNPYNKNLKIDLLKSDVFSLGKKYI